jgi:hypothetical protein
MKNSLWKVGFIVFISVMLVLSGCSFNIDLGGATPTSEPGVGLVTPQTGIDARPTGSATSSGTSAYTLSASQYVITSQAFAVYPPEGWENQSADSEIQVEYISPDGTVLITTRFTNTGYTLDTQAFENFINATQENYYSSEPNYAELSRDLHLNEGYGSVYVNFDFNNVPQQAERLYQQEGNVIFETEFWTDLDLWDANMDFFNQYLDGVRYNGAKVENYEPYMFIQTYTGPNDLFSFEYLTPWKYTLNSSDKEFYSESYLAPDQFASIDVAYFNDKKTYWSQADAGGWALSELENTYARSSSDLKIDSDQINDNGFEQLNWHTLQDGFSGITVFKAKDTEIMLLTAYWQKDYSDVYQSSLEYVISTFASPAQ